MKLPVILIIIATICIGPIFASNILAVFNTPSFSHYLTSVNLLKELARSGHNLTVITMTPVGKGLPDGYTEVTVPFDKEHHDGKLHTNGQG